MYYKYYDMRYICNAFIIFSAEVNLHILYALGINPAC